MNNARAIEAAHPVRAIVDLLHPYRRRLIAASTFQLLKDAPLWLVPIFTAKIVDAVATSAGVGEVVKFAALSALVLLVNYPAHLLYVRMYSRVYRSVAADLRNALAEHLQRLSIGFHNRRNASVIQNKVVRDVENVEMLLQQVSPVAAVSLNILVGSIVVTAIQVPQFLVVYLVTVPIAGGLVAWMRNRAASRNAEFRLRMEDLSATVGEMAALIPITRAHGLERTAVARVASTSHDVRDAGMALDRLNSRFETTSWVSLQLLSTLCLGVAGVAALSGFVPISPGQVVLLGTYFATLTAAVAQLVGLTPVISKGLEAVRSIGEVLQDADLEHNAGKTEVQGVRGSIHFDRVSFTFPGAGAPAISDLDLAVEPGETIAFVGSSGSGKSTTLNLALGFIRPTSGTIRIDGRDIESLDMRSLRRFVSVVPQESVLFEGTIYDNVAYGLESPDEGDVIRALTSANAMDIVDALPDGWSTRVGPRGATLSGGQRQRLAIARALVRDPRILLLDEATSALDSESEAKVKQALDTLMLGRTSLVVAHRLSTIRAADRIAVMERGSIVEVGTHDELLSMGGRYSQLAYAQGEAERG